MSTNAGTTPWQRESGLLCIWILGMFKPLPHGRVIAPFIAGDEATLGPKILYQTEEGVVRIEVLYESQTFWLNQKKIAELFGVELPTISYHLKEIYDSGELRREATLRKIQRVQREGDRDVTRQIEFYNLDAIISTDFSRYDGGSHESHDEASTSHPPPKFPLLLEEIKGRIQQAQTRAMLSVNAELVRLYWDIGRMIDQRQAREGWGAGVIPRLARELRNELPEVKGFSERNIKLMVQFAHEYPEAFTTPPAIVQQAVAQLPNAGIGQPLVAQIPWAHNVLLMQRTKDQDARLWYMKQILVNGWSRNVLLLMIKSEAHRRQGKAITNFERLLPTPQSDLVQQTLKDPYIFDFLTLEEPFHERELEINLLHQLERFLLELGQGFAFVGRQVHLEVGDTDFYIDLLFYHLKLRRFFVIDLKKGAFKPEHAGKMNFYLNVVDDRLCHKTDAPSIGLILCQDRNHIIAEYALRGADKPIGISEYELTRALPAGLKSALPTVEEIEAELADAVSVRPSQPLALPASAKHKPAKTPKRKN